MLEGVCFGLRDSLELIRILGVPIAQVRASGGGSRSPLWRQIQADVFGHELVLVNTSEGAAFGAALLAVWRKPSQTVHVTERTRPESANTNLYQESYAVYRSLYPALRLSFQALARLDS